MMADMDVTLKHYETFKRDFIRRTTQNRSKIQTNKLQLLTVSQRTSKVYAVLNI
jgi:hypothetical protein